MQKNNFFTIFMFVLICGSLLAQNQINSPYSRFGIGDLQSNVLSEYAAMGGSSIGSYNSHILNPYNPASYSAFNSNSFLFSTGMIHKTTKMQTNNLEQITNNSNLSHVILGFPMTKKIGASVGILPYSNIGYILEEELFYDELGVVNYKYQGDGGLSILYVGTAYDLTKNLSIGINANYLFGGLHRNKKVIFTDGDTFNTRNTSSISTKGFFYQIGVIYYKDINQETRFTLGITANNNASISAKKTSLTETYKIQSSYEIVKDTIENSSTGFTNDMVLPKNIGFGFTINKNDRWLLIGDLSWQDWSNYRMFEESDSLANSISLSGGIQFTSDYDAVKNYWRRIKFRIGGKYEKSYLQLYNTQLNEKSISFGLGLPLSKTKSEISLSVEGGERGTLKNNLIKEQFLRFQIGLNLRDIWFVKRKYD